MGEELKINLADKESLAKWSTDLNYTVEDLVFAVLRIGNKPQSVDDFLILNRRKKRFNNFPMSEQSFFTGKR